MQTPARILIAVTFCAPLSAQVFEETFSYSDGPIVPGWTQQRGTWAIKNQRLIATSGSLWAYITKDGFNVKDSVLDGDFFYDTGSTVQFGGLTSRHAGTNLDNNLVMCKIQNNGGAADFDRCFIYERPGTSIYKDIVPGTLKGHCRLITLDNTARMLVDTNMDGIFELDVGTKTLTTILSSGLVGMAGYQTTQMDNFKFFDAVLVEQTGSVPKIGTTYTMQLRAPQPQNTVYVCAASLSNTGIPIDTRKIPLAVDGLLLISLTSPGVFNFVGLLDGNGDGFPNIVIPNDPSLVGAAMFIGGMTFVPTAPSSIGNISNDHHIVIQP